MPKYSSLGQSAASSPQRASSPAPSERDVLREKAGWMLPGVRHPVCAKAACEGGTVPRVSDGKDGN